MFHDHKAFEPAQAGYRIVYHQGEHNRCPGCGKSHWIVGRMSSECAFCGTAIPLEGGRTIGSGVVFARGKTDRYAPLAA
ncbi:MAG: hypothetical protein HKN78_04870 [Sphingomonadaceae bacterium]|nr:hypothetical protein [Sphingomonadaceae bacterium]